MAAPDSPQSSTDQDGGHEIPEFQLPKHQLLLSVLGRIRGVLHEMPEDTACLQCGNFTANLVRISISHEDFHCTLPVSVCYPCSKKPPSVLSGVDDRLWWSLLMGGLAVALGIGQQWAFSAIAAGGVFALYRWMKPPQRLTASERLLKIRELLTKIPCVPMLLDFEPGAAAVIPLRDAAVSRTVTVPLGIFDESLIFHGRIQFLCNFDDLTRSGVHSTMLAIMITRIVELTKESLRHPMLAQGTAVQIDVALLPGRKTEFEIQILPHDSNRLKQVLMRQLDDLPALPVNFPVMFSIRRCDLQGGKHLDSLPRPFMSWQNRPGWMSGVSWAELALNIFKIQRVENPVTLKADECGAWRQYSSMTEELIFLHANLLQAENRFKEACEVYEQAISNACNRPELQFRYALFLEQAEQQERAAGICQELVKSVPQFTEAYAFLAHLQLLLGQPQDAQKTISAAPQEHRSPRFWLTSAEIAVELQELGSALGHLSTAMLKNQEFAEPFLLRAKILATQEKFALALADIVQFQKLSGPTLSSTQIKARLLNQLGQPEQAVNVFTEALQHYPGHPLFQMLRAEYLLDGGKLELARGDCDAILHEYPQLAPALELRARVNLESNDAVPVIADADRAIESGHKTSKIFMYRGVARLMQDDPERAIDDLCEACEIDPRNVAARFHLSRVKAFQGNIDDAIADLTLVLTTAHEWAEPRIARGFLSLNAGDTQTAAEDFEEAVRLAPTNVDAYRGRSLAFEAAGKNREALVMLDKALLLDPDNTDCRMGRSRILLADNDLKAARKDLDFVLSSAPDLLPALISRAQIRMQLGELDDAKKDFDAILKNHPEFTPALISRSVIFDQKGDIKRSLQDLEAARQNSPEHAQAIEISRLLIKTAVAHQAEHYEEAIQAATEVIELDPENYTAYRYRAGSYWYSEQFVEALQDYSHLIETQEIPDLGEFNGRGQIYAELGDYELALQDLERAVETGRKSDHTGLPYCLSGLGKTLTGLGRLDEAEEAFRESISLQPDNAWLHFNRGLLYLAKSEPENAGLCFDLSLRLSNPKLSPRKRARAQGFVERLRNE